MWAFYGFTAFEWLFFFFGFASVKFYLAWFELCRFWSLSILPATALYLFGVSVFVEYMSDFEIMFTSINVFLVAPLLTTMH